MARTNRRKFLQTSAAAGVGFWAAGGVSPKPSLSANEEIRFICIGVEGKGRSDSRDASRNGKVVAICDIDEDRLNKSSKTHKDAKKYTDWRKIMDDIDKKAIEADAATVSTPDHTHAPASIRSMLRGLHCFTQKPLTHTIYEARRMGEIAREKKLATMMGNQGTANNGLREAEAVVKSGALGAPLEVHVWTNRPVWPQGIDRPTDTPEVPSTIHWDQWLGAAKERAYHPAYLPFKWRGWFDFGTGALGDMACHTLNMPFAACELRDPVSVQAVTAGHKRDNYPSWSVIDFVYAANKNRGPVTLKWYDGGKKPNPAEVKNAPENLPKSGALIVCEKGTIFGGGDYANSITIYGPSEKPTADYERSPGHFNEWIRAIKTGKPAKSNFPDYAGPLTETILLGNLAVWAAPEKETQGKKVEWDAKNLVATNAPEVMHIVKKEYRKGYELEA